MEKETLDALKELLSKIPKEDLEKAVSELPEDKLEQLSGGGWWDDFKTFLGFGRSESSQNTPDSLASDRTYSSNEEIRNAYLAGEIKSLRNLRNAYKSIHPSFKGSMQDVLAILRL